MHRFRTAALLALTATLAIGCGEASDTSRGEQGPHPLPAHISGKDDNYISTFAQEFILSGTAHVTLPDGFSELPAEEQATTLQELVDQRANTLNRSLKGHIDGVIQQSNQSLSEGAAEYFTYFKRNATKPAEAEVLEDGRASFGFEVEFVGSNALIGLLVAGAETSFYVTVDDFGGENEEAVEVTITPSDSRDAFPRYDALFEDGVFDIAIHFGGDYNAERYDIETAKWTVETMLEGGFENPEVTSFETLTIDSPPFTRTLRVEGRDVEVRVTVVHADMVEAAEEERLSESMKQSLKTADIVMYSGHAGPDAGFILDYDPRHEIDNDEFAALELAEKYQIYVFDGCETYRTYVDDLMKNPAKTFDNLDVVTTVNTTPFSVGYQVIHQFLYWFTITADDGTHYPLSWNTMLQGINTEQFDDVHYGVHGVDENPQLNPNGGDGAMCQSCATDADCGGGGNFCLNYPGGGACGVACTTDEACGEGFTCAAITEDPEQFYLPKQCMARDSVCG